MPTYDVVFTAPVPDWILAKAEAEDARHARSWLLSQSWYERRRIDWEQRQVMFEAALTAEDEGMLTNAIELYQALGRTEDVRRLLGQQEQASAGG